MKSTIRKANEAEFPAIIALSKEIADFKRTPQKVSNTVEQMQAEQAYFSCYI